MTASPPATAAEVAALVSGVLEGPGELPVRGFSALDSATAEEATFIADEAHARRWADSKAGVALVSRGLDVAGHDPRRRALIRVDNADMAMISLLERFAPAPEAPPIGVHPAAWVHREAVLGPRVRIGPHATVDRAARIGAEVVIHSGARIGASVEIGDGSVVHLNAVVCERCRIGRGVILHPGCVIGSEGFGFRPGPDGRSLKRVPHLGDAVIEDGVEIGAGTCVDRAKFGSTIVGAGTKIDNLCQVGHNVRIGRACAIAGLTGIAGSAVIGDGVMIGGQVGIGDHVRVGSRATLAATCAVMTDVPDGATWGGVPAQDARTALRELAAIRKLPEWSRRLKHLLEGEAGPMSPPRSG